MEHRRIVLGLLAVTIGANAAWAVDTTGWCAGVTGTPVIACDDFDDYCPDPPCDDAIGDDTPDQAALLAVWPSDGCHTEPDEFGASDPVNAYIQADANCGELIRVWDPVEECWVDTPNSATEPCATSTPFALRQNAGEFYPDAKNEQYLFDGTSHRHDLRPRVQELNPTMGGVNGTDDDPLVLEFVLDLPGDSMKRFEAAQANRYVELTDGSDRAPAEITVVECDGPKYRPQALAEDDLDHSAIAVGVFAVLESGGVCSAEPVPTTYRLSVYNGDRWYELKPNYPLGGNDELKVGGHLNYVTMTITSSMIEVTIESTWDQAIDGERCFDVDGAGEPYTGTAFVPRVYTGGFAAMHVGNGACLPSRKKDYVDDLALTGGVLEPPIPTGACCLLEGDCVEATTVDGCGNRFGGEYAGDGTDCSTASCPEPKGACCLPTGFCDQMDQATCDAQGGFFHGPHTFCLDVLCCADPFADADGDGDVDQNDFGPVQACFTGSGGGLLEGCECFDRPELPDFPDGDGDVDEDDLGAFEACATGPGIPANDTCDD